MGSNPVESPEFFRFIRQLLKLSSKCEDHVFSWFKHRTSYNTSFTEPSIAEVLFFFFFFFTFFFPFTFYEAEMSKKPTTEGSKNGELWQKSYFMTDAFRSMQLQTTMVCMDPLFRCRLFILIWYKRHVPYSCRILSYLTVWNWSTNIPGKLGRESRNNYC